MTRGLAGMRRSLMKTSIHSPLSGAMSRAYTTSVRLGSRSSLKTRGFICWRTLLCSSENMSWRYAWLEAGVRME
jgi:hypothetical protein